jgi:hypothetical protein
MPASSWLWPLVPLDVWILLGSCFDACSNLFGVKIVDVSHVVCEVVRHPFHLHHQPNIAVRVDQSNARVRLDTLLKAVTRLRGGGERTCFVFIASICHSEVAAPARAARATRRIIVLCDILMKLVDLSLHRCRINPCPACVAPGAAPAASRSISARESARELGCLLGCLLHSVSTCRSACHSRSILPGGYGYEVQVQYSRTYISTAVS